MDTVISLDSPLVLECPSPEMVDKLSGSDFLPRPRRSAQGEVEQV